MHAGNAYETVGTCVYRCGIKPYSAAEQHGRLREKLWTLYISFLRWKHVDIHSFLRGSSGIAKMIALEVNKVKKKII